MSNDIIHYDDFYLRRKFFSLIRMILGKTVLPYISDYSFVKLNWLMCRYCRLNLDDVNTFNEKIQYLKLHDRNPNYIAMVDKVLAKEYVAAKIGREHIIPNIVVWDDIASVDFDALPNRFVLKCNHNSGLGMCICKDKTRLDKKKTLRALKAGFKQDYYKVSREWPYKDVNRRILVEEYITDESMTELKDYKIHCFSGVPRIIQVDYGRFTDHHGRNLYTPDWNFIDAGILYHQNKNHDIPRPKMLKKMIDIASTLSSGIPYVRVDLYQTEKQVYFGELTFYHGSGLEPFTSKSLEYEMGAWIDLSMVYDRVNKR